MTQITRNSYYILVVLFCACTTARNTSIKTTTAPKNSLTFVDEYVIPSNAILDSLEIGGLSGITYDQERYHIISDDPKKPRFFTTSIALSKNGIDTIIFEKVTSIRDTLKVFKKKTFLDLEDIHIWTTDTLIVIGEGFISKALDPTLLLTDRNGIVQKQFPLPPYFTGNPNHKNRPRHNGVFEGLTSSYDHKGIWVATELPLILDGAEPTFEKTGGPVRVTYFDFNQQEARSQFAYPLDKLTKDPKGAFGVNGVTAILQIDKHTFWILERAYSAGYGTQGNSVKIYEVTTQEATNTLDFEILESKNIKVATKRLLFDFETIRDRLTNSIIDNIEGMTFGPVLQDGSQSVFFVSDNNFNPPNKQINQVLLLAYKI